MNRGQRGVSRAEKGRGHCVPGNFKEVSLLGAILHILNFFNTDSIAFLMNILVVLFNPFTLFVLIQTTSHEKDLIP